MGKLSVFMLYFFAKTFSFIVSKEHSLNLPFDSNFKAKKWFYGGSTVLTQGYARLTPFGPNKGGWIKASSPLPKEPMDLTVDVRVWFGNYNSGGDGFAIHFVEFEDDLEEGDFYGVEGDYEGFAIVASFLDSHSRFDPYLFVVDNNSPDMKILKSDKNLQRKKILETPAVKKCRLNFYEKRSPLKLNIRILNNKIYVYKTIQNKKSMQMEFCLEATLSKPIKEKSYLSISASNGIFGTAVDISSIKLERKNLKNEKIKPSVGNVKAFLRKERNKLKIMNKNQSFTFVKKLKKILLLALVTNGMFLFLETIWELSLLSCMVEDKGSISRTLAVINKILPYSAVSLGLALLFSLVFLKFFSVLLLSVLFAWKAKKILDKELELKAEKNIYEGRGKIYTRWLYYSTATYFVYTWQSIGNLLEM